MEFVQAQDTAKKIRAAGLSDVKALDESAVNLAERLEELVRLRVLAKNNFVHLLEGFAKETELQKDVNGSTTRVCQEVSRCDRSKVGFCSSEQSADKPTGMDVAPSCHQVKQSDFRSY